MKQCIASSLAVLALLISACSSDDPDVSFESSDKGDAATDAVATTVVAEESTESTEVPAPDGERVAATLTVTPSEHIGLAALVSVVAEESVQVELTAVSGEHIVEVPRTAALTDTHDIPLVGMRAEQTYEISAEYFNESGDSIGAADGAEFTTSALPPWFEAHELTIDEDRAAPGYTIVEFDTLGIPDGAPSSQHLMAFDNAGEVVWYYTNTGSLAGIEATPAGTFNMFYWPFGIREVDVLGNVINNWRPQPAGTTGDTVNNELVVAEVDPDQVRFQGGLPALEMGVNNEIRAPVREIAREAR